MAGGMGTRIQSVRADVPKPMIEICGKPILQYQIENLKACGLTDITIGVGHLGHVIKEYFSNYTLYNSDVTFDFQNNQCIAHSNSSEPWKVTVADTGLNTMTGGRIKKVQKYIGDEPFCVTYGDGVSNIPIDDVIKFHKNSKKLATLTAVRPEGRFGILDMKGSDVTAFREKSKEDTGWINGGFMVLEPEVFDYIADDSTILEQEPLKKLAEEGQLNAYKHDGFWQCMDTLRDKERLQNLWESGNAPWKVW